MPNLSSLKVSITLPTFTLAFKEKKLFWVFQVVN